MSKIISSVWAVHTYEFSSNPLSTPSLRLSINYDVKTKDLAKRNLIGYFRKLYKNKQSPTYP